MESLDVATDSGKIAKTIAAIVATSRPNHRYAPTNTNGTAKAPAKAIGPINPNAFKPNSFVDNTCNQSPSGGLSTAIAPLGSKEA